MVWLIWGVSIGAEPGYLLPLYFICPLCYNVTRLYNWQRKRGGRREDKKEEKEEEE